MLGKECLLFATESSLSRPPPRQIKLFNMKDSTIRYIAYCEYRRILCLLLDLSAVSTVLIALFALGEFILGVISAAENTGCGSSPSLCCAAAYVASFSYPSDCDSDSLGLDTICFRYSVRSHR